MDNLIRNLSKKLIKLELENKNRSWQSQPSPNRNFNPQYRRPPLQHLQWERRDEEDHIQPPLYLEDDPEENIEETIEVQENQFSSLLKGENEIKTNGGEVDDLEA